MRLVEREKGMKKEREDKVEVVGCCCWLNGQIREEKRRGAREAMK